jgi:arsenate reductase (thioredoxin)
MKPINDTLSRFINTVEHSFNQIAESRKDVLRNLADFIKKDLDAKSSTQLNFICSHNSRRSHLAQVWAQIAAHRYGLPQVQSYSGGTEATAIYTSTIAALKSAGLEFTDIKEGQNPIFAARYALDAKPILLFSKRYDHMFNPQRDFGAILTCGEADSDCPYIPNASFRIPVTYVDPKADDGTEREMKSYEETCAKIAGEMFFVLSEV